MPRKHRVVDHIVERLALIGVDHIFGVDGANIEDLYDAAHFRADITAVLAKHEFSAATMADGYSRSGAGLGVVAATSGGGALNLVAALGESLTSRVPVLALVGQTATTMDGRGSFQDTSGSNGSLISVDVTDINGFAAAMRKGLDVDGPAVVSVECAANEMPPFATFLTQAPVKVTVPDEIPTVKEDRTDVAASA
jgi:thiamine pyrophosphate-dependent acetolactate synthase large subunit-like protein